MEPILGEIFLIKFSRFFAWNYNSLGIIHYYFPQRFNEFMH